MIAKIQVLILVFFFIYKFFYIKILINTVHKKLITFQGSKYFVNLNIMYIFTLTSSVSSNN
jgi:hypothetical protein